MENKIDPKNENEKLLLTFLRLTSEGKYAEVDPKANEYARWEEKRTDTPVEEMFLYSIR